MLRLALGVSGWIFAITAPGHSATPAPVLFAFQSGLDPSVQAAPTSQAPDGDSPSGVAFTPDGSRYLIAHRDTQNVLVYATATDALIAAVDLSGSPTDLAISPDGSHAATANVFEGTVSVIDLATLAEVSAASVSARPSSLEFTPDSARVVVVSGEEQVLDVVDLGTAAVTQSVAVPGVRDELREVIPQNATLLSGPPFRCINSATVAIPLTELDQLAFVDLNTGAVETLDTDFAPRGLDYLPALDLLAVAHVDFQYRVTLVDTANRSILQTVSYPTMLSGPVALKPDGTKIATAHGPLLHVADVATGTVSAGILSGFCVDVQSLSNGTQFFAAGTRSLLVSFDNPLQNSNLQGSLDIDLFDASPVDGNVVAVEVLRSEDKHRFDTALPTGQYLGASPTGPAVEADKPRRLAVSSDGQVAVTLNYLSRDLSIIDLQTLTLTGSVDLGALPQSVAITPDGTKAVVGQTASTIAVVDLAAQTVQQIAPPEPAGAPFTAGQIRISPDSRFAYVPSYASDLMHRLDLLSGAATPLSLPIGNIELTGTSDFFRDPAVELSPDGSLLAVCANQSNVVTLIDTASWSVRDTIPVGSTPSTLAFLPDGTGFVVGVEGQFLVPGTAELIEFFIDPNDVIEGNRIPLSSAPQGLAVDASGTRAFAIGTLPFNELEVADLLLNLNLGAVPLPGAPRDLVYDSIRDKVDVLAGGPQFDVKTPGLFQREAHLLRIDPSDLTVEDRVDLDFDCTDMQAGGGTLAVTAIDENFIVVKSQQDELEADVLAVSTSSGGTQSLQIDFGVGYAGDVYLLLGSANGNSPGLVLDGIPVPLVLDNYLLYTLTSANTGPFQNTVGVLDGLGRANCSLTVPAQTFTSLAGIQLNHAGLALDPFFSTVLDASNPVELDLLP